MASTFTSPFPPLGTSSNDGHAQGQAGLSSSPEPNDTNPNKEQHKRSYQACEACRQRKVKCDFGNPDNPRDGPCARCRREKKECRVAPQRRKGRDSMGGTVHEDDEHRSKRRMTSTGVDRPSFGNSVSNGFNTQNATSSFPPIQNTTIPRQSIGHANFNKSDRAGPQLMQNDFAARVFQQHSTSSLDNISNLAQAAALVEATDSTNSPAGPHATPVTRGRGMSKLNNGDSGRPGFQQAMQAWSKMRLIQSGWFTAKEAMDYVEYFYDQMAPMTPVATPDYRSPLKHSELLVDEPVLALAILTIASRHLRPEGRAAVSRSHAIHDKLWKDLRKMVQRLLWGQEQFGGGFCGAGSTQVTESTCGQITWRGSLRTMGTIEALLLLTDWQPRALHFPPGDDNNRLLAVGPEELEESIHGVAHTETLNGENRTNNHMPYAEWLEPSWRSDRMSWMLLGLAQALSFELGVFDKKHYDCQLMHDPQSDCARKQRIRRLVLVYVAQTSGRMGVPSMLMMSDWGRDKVFEDTAGTQRLSDGPNPVDLMQESWLHIAFIMWQANKDIFPSRKFTKDLVTTGEFKAKVAAFVPKMQKWKENFAKISDQISSTMRHVLNMEYEYARLYINSLGLQSVFESMAQHGSSMNKAALTKVAEANKSYIDEVTSAAQNILIHLMDGIAGEGRLRDAPIRTYLRSLSGMMFMMKRFSLGCPEQLVRDSFTLLTRTTDALTREVVDDTHLSQQTALLIKDILPMVMNTFIRIQAPVNADSDTASRGHSRPQTPRGSDQAAISNISQPPFNQMSHPLSNNITLQQSSNTYDYPSMTNDPLASIQARPIADFSDELFVPPPFPFDPSDTTLFDGLGADRMNGDWFAADLAPLFNNSSMNVGFGYGQTINMGPTIGDQDLIEALTQQSIGHPNNLGDFNGILPHTQNHSHHQGHAQNQSGMQGQMGQGFPNSF